MERMKVELNKYRNLALKVVSQTSMGIYRLISECVETTG